MHRYTRRLVLAPLLLVAVHPPAVSAAGTPAAVPRYAPWVRFHPDEKHWPDDPDAFIARSSLAWINKDRSCAPAPFNAYAVPIAPLGQVDPAKLGNGGYAIDACFHHGDDDVTTHLTTRDVTAPASHGDRAHRPAGVTAGFALDLLDTAQVGIRPAPRAANYGEPGKTPPLLYEYQRHKYIIYWFFYDFNSRIGDTHEGDWEHVVVHLDDTDRATAIAYYAHRCKALAYTWQTMHEKHRLHEGEHPQTYIAVGGHGTWPTDGDWLRQTFPCWFGGFGDRTAKGIVWRTWATTGGFVDARARPWYGYGGGWGQKTVGPAGPSAFKLGGAVPDDWR